MNSDYLIIDPRPLEAFKDKTFSDFKKKDVYNTLFKLSNEVSVFQSDQAKPPPIVSIELITFVVVDAATLPL